MTPIPPLKRKYQYNTPQRLYKTLLQIELFEQPLLFWFLPKFSPNGEVKTFPLITRIVAQMQL